MESHLHELEESNKELTDHKYHSEAATRKLKAKLKMTEEVMSMRLVQYVLSTVLHGVCISALILKQNIISISVH